MLEPGTFDGNGIGANLQRGRVVLPSVVGRGGAYYTGGYIGHPHYCTLDRRLLEFVDWIENFPAPAGIKRAVSLRKQKSGPVLTPLAPATSRLLEDFSAWFIKWLSNE